MRHCRHNQSVDVLKYSSKVLTLLGCAFRKGSGEFTRCVLRQHGILIKVFEIPRNPFDDLLAETPELIWGHVSELFGEFSHLEKI